MSVFKVKCVLKNKADLSESNATLWIICH